MKKRIVLSLILAVIASLYGCKPAQEAEELDYSKPLLPGQNALVKITDPELIPDFSRASQNLFNLEQSIYNSLNYMAKPSSRNFFPINNISHQDVVKSLNLFLELLHKGLSPEQMDQSIRDNFDVYMSIGCDQAGTVLFTGYYTPIFNGSFERSEQFKYPLYKLPADLVKGANGEILGRKLDSGIIVSYPSREEIDSSNMLAGNELLWMENPFEVYIAHVQGSAKIRLPDGKLITIGYAATNGHEYQSIAKNVSTDAGIPLDKMSLSAMIEYFGANPDQISRHVNRNPRYVFFRTTTGNPTGSINEPVTTLRSIATDKSIFPRAALTFIDTALPRHIGGEAITHTYQGFCLDQDTGGAIRAPGRCDVYMGVGDEAGLVAGKTYQEGKLFYLIAK